MTDDDHDIHESHDMEHDKQGKPFYCRLCGQFAEFCCGECVPAPAEKRFWNGSFEELVDGMTGGAQT